MGTMGRNNNINPIMNTINRSNNMNYDSNINITHNNMNNNNIMNGNMNGNINGYYNPQYDNRLRIQQPQLVSYSTQYGPALMRSEAIDSQNYPQPPQYMYSQQTTQAQQAQQTMAQQMMSQQTQQLQQSIYLQTQQNNQNQNHILNQNQRIDYYNTQQLLSNSGSPIIGSKLSPLMSSSSYIPLTMSHSDDSLHATSPIINGMNMNGFMNNNNNNNNIMNNNINAMNNLNAMNGMNAMNNMNGMNGQQQFQTQQSQQQMIYGVDGNTYMPMMGPDGMISYMSSSPVMQHQSPINGNMNGLMHQTQSSMFPGLIPTIGNNGFYSPSTTSPSNMTRRNRGSFNTNSFHHNRSRSSSNDSLTASLDRFYQVLTDTERSTTPRDKYHDNNHNHNTSPPTRTSNVSSNDLLLNTKTILSEIQEETLDDMKSSELSEKDTITKET